MAEVSACQSPDMQAHWFAARPFVWQPALKRTGRQRRHQQLQRHRDGGARTLLLGSVSLRTAPKTIRRGQGPLLGAYVCTNTLHLGYVLVLMCAQARYTEGTCTPRVLRRCALGPGREPERRCKGLIGNPCFQPQLTAREPVCLRALYRTPPSSNVLTQSVLYA